MKSLKVIIPSIVSIAGLFMISCTEYVPVYVPVEKKTTYKPKPKPVESAEGFRAVEKPTTYSN